MKLDDQIYVDEGLRKEQVDKAIAMFGLDKDEEDEEDEII